MQMHEIKMLLGRLPLCLMVAAFLLLHTAQATNDIATKAMRNICLVYYQVRDARAMHVPSFHYVQSMRTALGHSKQQQHNAVPLPHVRALVVTPPATTGNCAVQRGPDSGQVQW